MNWSWYEMKSVTALYNLFQCELSKIIIIKMIKVFSEPEWVNKERKKEKWATFGGPHETWINSKD